MSYILSRFGRGNKKEELRGPIQIYAVYVKEVNCPKGVEPLEWMLLTDVGVKSFRDAVERISWYGRRWNIEVYHKVLKSGCRVEDCRLETVEVERLIQYLTVISIIGWRIYWMSQINRQYAGGDCKIVLTEHEWKALYCMIHRLGSYPKRFRL